MLQEIDDETVNNPEHDDYGMFILVLMSHGAENECIFGTDGKLVKLNDVYFSLSAKRFPEMSGKPKFVIVQACAGGIVYIQVVISH